MEDCFKKLVDAVFTGFWQAQVKKTCIRCQNELYPPVRGRAFPIICGLHLLCSESRYRCAQCQQPHFKQLYNNTFAHQKHKTTDPTEPNIAAFYKPSVINGCKERHDETDNWCDCLKANVENGEKFFQMPSHPVAEIVIMCFPCDRETLIMAKEVTMKMIMVNDEDNN